MPSAVKNLPAVGDTLEMKCDSSIGLDGHNSLRAMAQYISGAGTVQMEVTSQVTDPAVWAIPFDDFTGVAIAALAAVGVQYGRLPAARVRLRKTVGVLDCLVGLNVD